MLNPVSRRSSLAALALAALALAALGASTAAAQPSRTLTQKLDSLAGSGVLENRAAGIVTAVVKGNDTLLFKGYGKADVEWDVPMPADAMFEIGSVTKQFTAAAVMQLVEAGKITLDDDITKYVPNTPVHGRRVTIRHLLNHTSGIPSYTDVGNRFGRVMRLDLARDSLVAMVANDSLMFEPGRYFYYNNTGYYLLGMLIEKVSGKTYAEFLQERLFAPLGMTSTSYCSPKAIVKHRAQGYDVRGGQLLNTDYVSMELPYAAGSLCSSVRDLVKWTAA
ncbi:MAG TPA: serine hydrolase domain-containing protein, partial [Gemmatimonadaceae bacterium]|nr:serine hydrolase domain-containing protein [Gemmatimonadaceae bacterium]